ncbi:MAG: hypothetical protein GWO38_24005, partial [Phycisphaerae bacterium]|nr:hypothetical protein [Phycisphaerae bacterium]NIX30614.1 hypothetical protein [Phycisphaerae bacterium]
AGMSGHEEDSGTAKGLCCKVKYEYDSKKNLLLLEPVEMADHLTHEKLERTIRFAMAAEQNCGPSTRWPKQLGVYNYVEPFINNQSGGVLTFSGDDISNGTLVVTNNKIPDGTTLQAFDARSSVASGIGCKGKVTFILADGNTNLILSYMLDGIGIHSFNAGISGLNAAHYSASITCNQAIQAGYTYMWPVVTLVQD